ncbi:hypothetical protein AAG906_027508 [Vitis piasezkii]
MLGLEEKREDWLVELPDDILSTIISLLPLKEAVRTGILSKRWRSIWTCHSELWFDAASVLGIGDCSTSMSGNQPELNSHMQSSKFVERVDQFMYYRSQGRKINSFSIHFPLGKEFMSHIDQWITCAVMKGVENIDLDLSEYFSFNLKRDDTSSTAFQIYEFPCRLFSVPGGRCTLKHLRLASCHLSALPSSNTLTSLITVDLQRVNVSDQQLQDLLSTCSHLDRLSLCVCNGLVNLSFSALNLQLKFLSIKNCFRLETIEIHAADLVTFKYGGHLPSFSFKNVPKLAKASLEFFIKSSRTEGVMYALTRFPRDLPQLETLKLEQEDWQICVGKLSSQALLASKPLFSPSFTKQPKEIERFLPECPHRHLSILQINGFYGNQHEVDLLKYLLHNLVALELLVVAPSKKGGEYISWRSQAEHLWCRARLQGAYEWLLAPHIEFALIDWAGDGDCHCHQSSVLPTLHLTHNQLQVPKRCIPNPSFSFRYPRMGPLPPPLSTPFQGQKPHKKEEKGMDLSRKEV